MLFTFNFIAAWFDNSFFLYLCNFETRSPGPGPDDQVNKMIFCGCIVKLTVYQSNQLIDGQPIQVHADQSAVKRFPVINNNCQ